MKPSTPKVRCKDLSSFNWSRTGRKGANRETVHTVFLSFGDEKMKKLIAVFIISAFCVIPLMAEPVDVVLTIESYSAITGTNAGNIALTGGDTSGNTGDTDSSAPTFTYATNVQRNIGAAINTTPTVGSWSVGNITIGTITPANPVTVPAGAGSGSVYVSVTVTHDEGDTGVTAVVVITIS